MADASSDFDRDMRRLETELKRLETEYQKFFGGVVAKPPAEARSRVEALVRQYDRMHLANYGDRFRFTTLQARYATFRDLWDRAMRARDEGRAGPLSPSRRSQATERDEQVLSVAVFQDPGKEDDKLRDLYETFADARRDSGEASVSFPRFAELVRKKVEQLQQAGSAQVALRVAVTNGHVTFTAQGVSDGTR